jgi:tRNA uridine 5-carbamoylmethylation protein Kti12
MVEPISKASEIQELKEIKPPRSRRVERKGEDTLTISSEAKSAFQLEKEKKIAMKAALEADDIRWEKVRLAQERIKEGFYNNPEIVEEIASRILEENDLLQGTILGLR